ncbi:hypothetical protein QTP70_028543 [Hemibagrus guttatus]|uniref:Transcription elongation factor SPT4 n=1 Tax=Hemibagrus guttatus TaxID=175788 RepID=A0AAE0UKL5_9TELE|nr:hypothetical protein QTP70_028543 [Hemibagrus guttatus]
MGKCKDLSEFDKDHIVMARRLDQSISKTAALVGCSQFAVHWTQINDVNIFAGKANKTIKLECYNCKRLLNFLEFIKLKKKSSCHWRLYQRIFVICGLVCCVLLSRGFLPVPQGFPPGPLVSTSSPKTCMTIDQFEYDGCDNCESYLQMKGNREMVYECTSSSFDGIIAMMSPEDSWVAKWQRIGNFKAGVYAVTVTGRLPPGWSGARTKEQRSHLQVQRHGSEDIRRETRQ